MADFYKPTVEELQCDGGLLVLALDRSKAGTRIEDDFPDGFAGGYDDEVVLELFRYETEAECWAAVKTLAFVADNSDGWFEITLPRFDELYGGWIYETSCIQM